MTRRTPSNIAASVRKSGLDEDAPEFLELLSRLREFLLFPMRAASGNTSVPTEWPKGGPWAGRDIPITEE